MLVLFRNTLFDKFKVLECICKVLTYLCIYATKCFLFDRVIQTLCTLTTVVHVKEVGGCYVYAAKFPVCEAIQCLCLVHSISCRVTEAMLRSGKLDPFFRRMEQESVSAATYCSGEPDVRSREKETKWPPKQSSSSLQLIRSLDKRKRRERKEVSGPR